MPRVAKRRYYVRYFAFLVAVPTAGEVTVPVRLKAQADEMPDDVDETVETLKVRVVGGCVNVRLSAASLIRKWRTDRR